MLRFLFTSTLAKQPSFPSAAAARAYFRAYPTSARWDPRIVEVVMRHGLVGDCPAAQDPDAGDEGGVRLKTRPFDETALTYGWRAAHEVWAALPTLEPRLSLHWVMSGKSAAWYVRAFRLPLSEDLAEANADAATTFSRTGGRAMTRRTVWRRPANASNVLIPDAGHSVSPLFLVARTPDENSLNSLTSSSPNPNNRSYRRSPTSSVSPAIIVLAARGSCTVH